MSRTAPMLTKRRRGGPVFTARPFAGAGVSLYAQAEETVQYRRLRIVGRPMPRGLPPITKTARVASAADPATEIEYTLPAELLDTTVSFEVRRYLDDVEHLSDAPLQITTDSGGEDVTTILGTAVLLNTELLAGGYVRLRFRYDAVPFGLQPETFTASRTAGPTSPADVSIDHVPGTPFYEIDTPQLSDASPYTYKLTATHDATTVDLLTGITFTADASGPPAPSAGSAEAW